MLTPLVYIRLIISSSVYSSAGFFKILFFSALLRTAFLSIPAPSSSTVIISLSSFFLNESLIMPTGALPICSRTSILSIPWSTAFLTICTSALDIFSLFDLSKRVSCPLTTSLTGFFNDADISSTTTSIFCAIATKSDFVRCSTASDISHLIFLSIIKSLCLISIRRSPLNLSSILFTNLL